jgi:hypothetical protein
MKKYVKPSVKEMEVEMQAILNASMDSTEA